jgi:superfamily II DNA or RNA helicase
MPRRLDDLDLRRHVGARFAKRARRLRVDDGIRQGDHLHGRVGVFEVSVQLGEPLTSRCTCIYGERCEHVGALLAYWIDTPDRFASRAEQAALPTEPVALRRWLEEHDPELLRDPLESYLDRGRWMPARHPLWSASGDDVDTALDRLAFAVERGTVTPEVATRPLHAGLTAAVRGRAIVRAGVARAAAWRETPPDEAVLRPLWEAARRVLPTDVLAKRAPGAFGRVELLPSHDLRFALASLPYHPVTLPVAPTLLDGASGLALQDVAGVVLDSLVGRHQPEVRAAVLGLLQVPLWERALAQLDRALALDGPKSAPALGWRIRLDGAEVRDVQLVSLTPYVRRDGFRTKRVGSIGADELPLAADRAAWAALRAKEPVPSVVEQLVGHPRVVDEQGMVLSVRRSTLEVAVEPADGVTLRVLVAGLPVEPAQLGVLRQGGGRGLLSTDGVVHVVRTGPVVEGLLAVLARFGNTFPAEARGPLLDRLDLLDRMVPLRMADELAGTEVARDDRPLLLLEPDRDGALQVSVRLEPLPGGPRVLPGEGGAEVATVEDGKRRFVRRDLAEEEDRVQAVLADLPLPELGDWEALVPDPEAALELVWALRDRDDVRSLWPGARWSIRGEAGAGSVRARATRRRDWFGIEGELRDGETTVRLNDLLRSIRANQRFVQLDDGSWLRLADGLRRALRTAARIGTDEATPRLPPLAAARAMLALEEAGGDALVPDELVDLASRIRAADRIEASAPAGLQATLRDYQLAGLTWLRRLASWSPGAVLADEMGLGKTLQALALVLDRGGPTLVVAPASVNLNWQREAQRFVPAVRTVLYRGRGRKALLEGPYDLWIISYELLVRDLDTLCTQRFATVVFDEAQALKNPRTKRARAARALDVGFTLALTGTPIENHLLELWSLMRVTVPGLLGPKEHFHERFGKKQMAADSMGDGHLGALVRPFLLRRTKRVVAPELPPRTETIDWVELDARERITYDRLRLAAVNALTEEGRKGERLAVLAALTRLRQVACAARLVDPEAPAVSSKIARLVERVDATLEADGALLVFSQFTQLLDLAEAAVSARGHASVRLDGSTPLGRRQAAVDAFQAGEVRVFFISLKAGGTGLNLTAANTVVHLDPWWNPAAEDQASDRAHRIGQDQAVTVVRLVAAGTIEEQVLAMHEEKRRLADQLFEGTAGALSMRADELLALLGA